MNSDQTLPPELQRVCQRFDELVTQFDQHPEPLVQERMIELLQCVDLLHRAGIRRLAELFRASGLEQAARAHPEVQLLFALYECGPEDERARAEAVLENVQPYIQSHGGHLEVLDAKEGVIRVRLSGTCQSCRFSDSTLHGLIEQRLREGYPGFARIEVISP